MSNMEVGYYATIPVAVIEDRSIKANAKLLYGVITSLTKKWGYCVASNSYLKNCMGLTESGISRLVGELVKAEYLTVEYTREGKQIKSRKLFLNLTTLQKKIDSSKRQGGIDICQGGIDKRQEGVLTNGQRDNKSLYNKKEHKKTSCDSDKIPYNEIMEAYKQILPELPQPIKINNDRKRKLNARWRENKNMQNLDAWVDYFNFIRQSDWLMGKVDGKTSPATFDWVISDTYFTRICEGNYIR